MEPSDGNPATTAAITNMIQAYYDGPQIGEEDPAPALMSFLECVDVYTRSFEVDEITCDPVPVTQTLELRDPITMQVMRLPCRSVRCAHLQCFEWDTYISMNSQAKRHFSEFICPVCYDRSPPATIHVDKVCFAFLAILESPNRVAYLDVLPITKSAGGVARDDTACDRGETITIHANGHYSAADGGLSSLFVLECLASKLHARTSVSVVSCGLITKAALGSGHLDPLKIPHLRVNKFLRELPAKTLRSSGVHDVLHALNTMPVEDLSTILNLRSKISGKLPNLDSQMLDKILLLRPYYCDAFASLRHALQVVDGIGSSRSVSIIDNLYEHIETLQGTRLHGKSYVMEYSADLIAVIGASDAIHSTLIDSEGKYHECILDAIFACRLGASQRQAVLQLIRQGDEIPFPLRTPGWLLPIKSISLSAIKSLNKFALVRCILPSDVQDLISTYAQFAPARLSKLSIPRDMHQMAPTAEARLNQTKIPEKAVAIKKESGIRRSSDTPLYSSYPTIRSDTHTKRSALVVSPDTDEISSSAESSDSISKRQKCVRDHVSSEALQPTPALQLTRPSCSDTHYPKYPRRSMPISEPVSPLSRETPQQRGRRKSSVEPAAPEDVAVSHQSHQSATQVVNHSQDWYFTTSTKNSARNKAHLYGVAIPAAPSWTQFMSVRDSRSLINSRENPAKKNATKSIDSQKKTKASSHLSFIDNAPPIAESIAALPQSIQQNPQRPVHPEIPQDIHARIECDDGSNGGHDENVSGACASSEAVAVMACDEDSSSANDAVKNNSGSNGGHDEHVSGACASSEAAVAAMACDEDSSSKNDTVESNADNINHAHRVVPTSLSEGDYLYRPALPSQTNSKFSNTEVLRAAVNGVNHDWRRDNSTFDRGHGTQSLNNRNNSRDTKFSSRVENPNRDLYKQKDTRDKPPTHYQRTQVPSRIPSRAAPLLSKEPTTSTITSALLLDFLE